jgi:protein-ribulosamine 3-kinase
MEQKRLSSSKLIALSSSKSFYYVSEPFTYDFQVAEGENGRGMMHGEYESMKAIETFSTNFVPHPIAWGTFASDPNQHFMVSEFREMDREVPDMEPTCSALAQMHLASHSAGIQKFGFPIMTYNGSLAQDNDWADTWEKFYVQQLKGMLKLEEESQGPQTDELQGLLQQIFDKVVPRLLRPMETSGHKITPSLIHGDFWHGNVSTDVDTGDPVTYDASAFWGHNEYDIRTMTKRARYKFGPAWQREYLRHYPAAYPQEDFEARSELYILRSKVHDSALFAKNSKFRDTLIEHAKSLVENYGESYESWLEASKENQKQSGI